MPLPEWWTESTPKRMRAKVEGLPLEKISLGRRTLRAANLKGSIGQTLNTILPLLMIFLLQASKLPAGIKTIFTAFYIITAILLPIIHIRRIKKAWEKGRQDGAAEAWKHCEEASKPLLKELEEHHFVLAISAVIAVMHFMLKAVNINRDDMGLIMAISVSLPGIAGDLSRAHAKGLRGLHGLCRDSEPKAEAKEQAKISFRQRLEQQQGT